MEVLNSSQIAADFMELTLEDRMFFLHELFTAMQANGSDAMREDFSGMALYLNASIMEVVDDMHEFFGSE